MRRRFFRIFIIILVIFFLLGGISMAILYAAIKSEKLQNYIVQRAQAATGLQIAVGSFELDLPFGIQAKTVSARVPGKENQTPLLSAEKLRLRTSLGALLRRQLTFVEFVSPRVNLAEQDVEFFKQKISFGKGQSGGLSSGLIRITNGSIILVFSPVRAQLDNVNATFGAFIFPTQKQALLLDAEEAQFHIERANEAPYDATLRQFKSKFSLVPSETSVSIEGEARMLATAGIPLLSLPPDFPFGLSMSSDYTSHDDSLQNTEIAIDLPLFRDFRAYGSVSDLTGTPAPKLTFTAVVPHVRELVEYIEPLKRPQYEGLVADAEVKLAGEIRGTINKPAIYARAEAVDGSIEWNNVSVKSIRAEMPISYKAESISIGPGILYADKASAPVGKQTLSITGIRTRIKGDSSTVRVEDVVTFIDPFGRITGHGSYEFDSGIFRATASLHDVASQEALDFISAAAGKSRNNIALSGSLSADCNIEAVPAGKLTQLKATFKSNLKNADFSPSASTRLTGINAILEGSLMSVDLRNKWKFDIHGDSGKFTLKSPVIEKGFSAARYPFSISGTYGLKSGKITGGAAAVDFGPLGRVKATGDITLRSGKVDLALAVEKLSLQELRGALSPAFYALPENLSLSGMADGEGKIKAILSPAPKNLNGNFSLKLNNGELASGELITAAGITAQAQGSFESESPADLWTLDTRGTVGGFELLIQTYYNSFQDSTIPFSFSANYAVGERTLKNLKAKMGLADIGEVSADGTIRFGTKTTVDVQLSSSNINLNKFYEQIGRQILNDSSPLLKEASISGRAAGQAAIIYNSDFWQTAGNVEIVDGHFSSGDDSVSVGSLAARLPFELHSAPEATEGENDNLEFVPADFGDIQLKNITLGPAKVAAIDLDVVLKNNAMYVKSPAPVEVLDGKFSLGEVRARNIFSSSAQVKTSFSAEDINVEPISQSMGLPKIPGQLNALFPNILLSRSRISTSGTAKIYSFGGSITANSVAVEQPFSAVRTLSANLKFDDIRLLELTDVLKFGTITGVLEGTIEGLEISQGQPASFVADFETVEKRGIPQTINFDAIENISILGTGSGFPAAIGRGFFSFVDQFRYGKIGFSTSLKNDNFRIRGKVVKDGSEYFVRGVLFGPSINVINRNPGQTVSFKSMLERISRIKRSQDSKQKNESEKEDHL